MDLEEAIRIHLENEKKCIYPDANPIEIRNIRLHVKTIEQAPRDSERLKVRIGQLKLKMKECWAAEKTDLLYRQLMAYERLLAMVRAAENGRPMKGYAY